MDRLIGSDPGFQKMRSRLALIARAGRTTLLTGETGSGKDVVARELHRLSPRADRPMVVVQCGALPENLLESELFGYRRGAFTGAQESRPGLIRTAGEGTLFLDEINSLSVAAQSRLLRFLETGEYRPVGSDRPEYSNAWVVAATNQDLSALCQRGQFRADLHFRLSALCLQVPALRTRGRDVLDLAEHFLGEVAPERRFSPGARMAMCAWAWPGNVRELKHRVEGGALFASGDTIDAVDLGLSPGSEARGSDSLGLSLAEELWAMIEQEGLNLRDAVACCERILITEGLRRSNNNRTRAAASLGIHLRTLYKKLPHFEPVCPDGHAVVNEGMTKELASSG